MNLQSFHKIHRWTAIIMTMFILFHLINHLVAIAGIEAHQAFMDAFRQIYRHPIGEGILLIAILIQIITGILKIRLHGWKQEKTFDRIQIYSGAYLAFFLLAHTSAILIGRNVLNYDTDFYFAAQTVALQPFVYFFAPYYILAIFSFFAHLACAGRWAMMSKWELSRINSWAVAIMGLGIIIALIIVFVFGGGMYEIVFPEGYGY